MRIEIQQNLEDAAKAVLRGNFMALTAYIRKEERPKISDLRFHFEPKVNQMTNNIVNMRAEINVIRNSKQ